MFWGGKTTRWRRAAVGLLIGAVAGAGIATPALADEPATGIARTGPGYGSVQLEGKRRPAAIHPLSLEIAGRAVPAYCIDLNNPVARNEQYREDTWSEAQVANLPKVQWVLLHGYPEVAARDLLATVKVQAGKISDQRLGELAYSATQLAVWHFSDGAVLSGNRSFRGSEYAIVTSLYRYLVANATAEPEPLAELSIDPGTATATVGRTAGPFTVTGPSGDITLTVQGGRAVDSAGRPVTTVTNGDQFWLTRQTPGEVSVSASAAASRSTGRVFLYHAGRQHKKQKLILAGSVGRQLTAAARATLVAEPESTPSPSPSVSRTPSTPVTPSETPPAPPGGDGDGGGADGGAGGDGGDLPLTGASLTAGIGVGVLLLVAGVLAVVLVRRRRVHFTA